jgi:hypothetical protein
MYVAVLMVVLGEALWWGSWVILGYAGTLWVALHAWVVVYEEPTLRRRFGRPYERYSSAVPRWLGIAKNDAVVFAQVDGQNEAGGGRSLGLHGCKLLWG